MRFKSGFLLFVSLLITFLGYTQGKYVYTIKADSVKITNCDSAELILENHTQGVPGFLYNTGNGRTQFRRGLVSLGNNSYMIGADTLNLATNAWLQGGNSFGVAGVFGTMDNNPVNFYSNGVQQMSLQPNGHLLVNTTTDDGHDNVQVNGSIYIPANGGYLTNSTTALGSQIGSLTGGSIRLRWGTSDGDYMSFYDLNDTKVKTQFASAADNRPFCITDSVGFSFLGTPYVDIGSETGQAKLSVNNPFSSGLYDFALARSNADSGVHDFLVIPPGPFVDFGIFADNGVKMQLDGTATIAGNVGIGILHPSAQLHTSGSVCFAGLTADSTQTNVLVSDNNGNLYYRSATSLAAADFPRSSLAVNGTITAKQLKLRPAGWADYVLDSSYRLPALSDVESYIRQEHHLPGISSAAEVQKDGVDVGDNQQALLKKIEELTLYTIQQDHEMEELKKEMAELRQLIIAKTQK